MAGCIFLTLAGTASIKVAPQGFHGEAFEDCLD
jgi:hypothetical protein